MQMLLKVQKRQGMKKVLLTSLLMILAGDISMENVKKWIRQLFPKSLLTKGTEKLEVAAGRGLAGRRGWGGGVGGEESGVQGELFVNRWRRYEHIKCLWKESNNQWKGVRKRGKEWGEEERNRGRRRENVHESKGLM